MGGMAGTYGRNNETSFWKSWTGRLGCLAASKKMETGRPLREERRLEVVTEGPCLAATNWI